MLINGGRGEIGVFGEMSCEGWGGFNRAKE